MLIILSTNIKMEPFPANHLNAQKLEGLQKFARTCMCTELHFETQIGLEKHIFSFCKMVNGLLDRFDNIYVICINSNL